jgi:hypothetical protein
MSLKRTIAAGLAVVSLLATAAHATDLVLARPLYADTPDGERVVAQLAQFNGCEFIGTYHNTAHTVSSWAEKLMVAGGAKLTDSSIELTTRRCGKHKTAVDIIVPLSPMRVGVDNEAGDKMANYIDSLRHGETDFVRLPQEN